MVAGSAIEMGVGGSVAPMTEIVGLRISISPC